MYSKVNSCLQMNRIFVSKTNNIITAPSTYKSVMNKAFSPSPSSFNLKSINVNNIFNSSSKSIVKTPIFSIKSVNDLNNNSVNDYVNNNLNKRTSVIFNNNNVNYKPLSLMRFKSSQPKRYYTQTGGSRSSDYMNSNTLIWVIIALNGIVFVLWQDRQQQNQVFMYRNFTLSSSNLRERPYTLLTAAFSHNDFYHFLFNMIGLYTIGGSLVQTIGGPKFLALYLGGAVFSSWFYCYFEERKLRQSFHNHNPFTRPTMRFGLGASGALSSAMISFACMFPTATFLFMGLVPVPAWALAGGYIAYDFYNEYKRSNTMVAHSAHIGGALFGGLFYMGIIRRLMR